MQKFFLFEILDNFIEMVRRSNLEPTKKYKYPLTTSHEIGWITTPLVKIKTKLIILNELD